MSSDDTRKLRLTIDAFLAGDSVQYRSIHAKITRFVHHQQFDRSIDVEDLVSEVMLTLYQSLKQGSLRGDSLTALSAYIYGISRYTVRRAWQRQRRLVYMEQPPDRAGSDQSQRLEDIDLARRIHDALDENCRKLLDLKFLQGWVNEEIAAEVGKTKNAVSTAIFRCLKKVAEFDFVRESL